MDWTDEERAEYGDMQFDRFRTEHPEAYRRHKQEYVDARRLKNICEYGPNISTQTLRHEDLIPAFLDALRVIDLGIYDEYIATGLGESYTLEDIYDENSRIYRPVSSCEGIVPDIPSYYILSELCVALTEVCPPGVRFGANPGNASDIGFWPAPCERHEDEEWPLEDCPDCQANVEALHECREVIERARTAEGILDVDDANELKRRYLLLMHVDDKLAQDLKQCREALAAAGAREQAAQDYIELLETFGEHSKLALKYAEVVERYQQARQADHAALEQARAEGALRMWKDCALALDGVQFPENASLGSVWAACSCAIQDLEPSKVKEADEEALHEND